ncbi:MAG: hypothetical protein IKP86_03875 [Anaerolineaceae bacterium]|nr:hypothetical protein [Anaerolineaceae bacterium]
MNRKSLLIVVVLVLLSQVTGVFAKGSLKDKDAYQAYMGESKANVSLFAPEFELYEELGEDVYLVDHKEYGRNDYASIMVTFDANDEVAGVAAFFTTGAMEQMKETGFLDFIGNGLWNLGKLLVNVCAAEYVRNSESEGIMAVAESLLFIGVKKGTDVLDSWHSSKVEQKNAEKLRLALLGIESEMITGEYTEDGSKKMTTGNGEYIVITEYEPGLYAAMAIRF